MTELIISLLVSLSPNYDIHPSTAIAVARTESSLNTRAVGPLGEIGLFQVRPEFSKFTREELFDININIQEGLRILSEAKRKCKHQVDRAWLVCYNVGIRGGSKIKHPKKFPYYIKVMNRIADAN